MILKEYSEIKFLLLSERLKMLWNKVVELEIKIIKLEKENNKLTKCLCCGKNNDVCVCKTYKDK